MSGNAGHPRQRADRIGSGCGWSCVAHPGCRCGRCRRPDAAGGVAPHGRAGCSATSPGHVLLLRRTVSIGACRCGADGSGALPANGSGGHRDLGRALLLLVQRRRMIRWRPRSSRCWRRWRSMRTAIRSPWANPKSSPRGRGRAVSALLPTLECAHVATAAGGHSRASHVCRGSAQRASCILHPKSGTADEAVIGPTREDLVVQALNRRDRPPPAGPLSTRVQV